MGFFNKLKLKGSVLYFGYMSDQKVGCNKDTIGQKNPQRSSWATLYIGLRAAVNTHVHVLMIGEVLQHNPSLPPPPTPQLSPPNSEVLECCVRAAAGWHEVLIQNTAY